MADLVALVVLLEKHTLGDAAAYLEAALSEAKLPESPQPFQEATLSVNHDFTVVPSWDRPDAHATGARRAALVCRLRVRRALPVVLLACLRGNAAELAAATREWAVLEVPADVCAARCFTLVQRTAAACLALVSDEGADKAAAVSAMAAVRFSYPNR